MNATVEDILQSVRIPEDDGRLNKALADLDSKLAAWSGAILNAQTSLRDIVQHQPDPVVEEIPATRTEPIKKTTAEPRIETSAPPAAAEGVKPPAEAPACKISKEPEIIGESPVATAPTEPGDDEALLATLDPETAKRIQVLRRLPGQKKSVRELLEKHRMASPPTVPTQPSKKSFWRK